MDKPTNGPADSRSMIVSILMGNYSSFNVYLGWEIMKCWRRFLAIETVAKGYYFSQRSRKHVLNHRHHQYHPHIRHCSHHHLTLQPYSSTTTKVLHFYSVTTVILYQFIRSMQLKWNEMNPHTSYIQQQQQKTSKCKTNRATKKWNKQTNLTKAKM